MTFPAAVANDGKLVWAYVTDEGRKRGFSFGIRQPWHDAIVFADVIGWPPADGELISERKEGE